jgi:hypothetical protein
VSQGGVGRGPGRCADTRGRRARAAGGLRRGSGPRLAWPRLLLLALLLACAGSGPSDQAPREPGIASEGGTPVLRSRYPRPGRFSYQLVGVSQRDGGARVELRIHNGTPRHQASVLLRVVVVGRPGEWRSAPLAVGALPAGGSRTVRSWLPEVPFRIRDVHLELVHGIP